MTTDRILTAARALIDPALRAAVDAMDERNRAIVAYHLGYRDAKGEPATADSGKTIRGALALLSARAAGAGAADGVPAAVAVELVHQYSLLHDDIVDEDRTRRHRPAAWTVFGSAQTIIAGDALAARAVRILLDSDLPGSTRAARNLADATERMLAGQAADLAFEALAVVSLDECLAMVADKTGALLACAASLGAELVGGDPATVAGLASFGHHLGLAFQLVDDILGIWGDPAVTGKPAGADLAARKKSLPVTMAMGSAGSAGERMRRMYDDTRELGPDRIAEGVAALEDAGADRWARDRAAAESDAALGILADLAISGEVRAEFAAITLLLSRRES